MEKVIPLNLSILLCLFITFLDSRKEIKSYANRKRQFLPIDYCESRKRHRSNRRLNHQHQTKLRDLEGKVQLKLERITNIKRAIIVLNRQSDKQKIEKIEECDLDEYDNFLSEDESDIDYIENRMDETQPGPSHYVDVRMQSEKNVATASARMQVPCSDFMPTPTDINAAGTSHQSRNAFAPICEQPEIVSENASGNCFPLEQNENGMEASHVVDLFSTESICDATVGDNPLQTDSEFSLEYSYTTDVR